MPRLQVAFLVLGLLFPVVRCGVARCSAPLSGDRHDGPAASELVRQLGEADFAVRNRAMARLVRMGVDSMEALEQGVQSPDREVRFRCRHALKIVRENDFQRRLQAFAAGRDTTESYQLPGWSRFFKEVGGSPEARALFVEMQQAEPDLLTTVEQAPERLTDALVERIIELQNAVQGSRQPSQVSLGTIATILFLLNGEHQELPAMVSQNLGAYFRYPTFASAVHAGSQRELLRAMLGNWIERSKGWDAYHAIYLAMQYDIPQGLTPARKVLTGEVNEPNQSFFICYALLAFAKFGNEADIPLIEPLLNDATPYGSSVAVGGAAKFRTEIRDIALATLVRLARQDPKEFGFDRLRSSASQVFNTGTLAFEDDNKREEAIQKWRTFRHQDNSASDPHPAAGRSAAGNTTPKLVPESAVDKQ